MSSINLWKFQERNYVNGPGCRFVIWVQGCHLACPECWNKHTWAFTFDNVISVNEMFEQIANTEGITGVTFTGGEPFTQSEQLYNLAYRIKNELNLNLQIFTGYEIKELIKASQKKLLNIADIVVAGRFDPSKINNNQKVYEQKELKWCFNNTDVEVEVDEKGDIIITGYPSDILIEDIKGEINERV